MSLIVEKSVWAFLLITVVVGGGGAYLTGRAVARSWRPFWLALLGMIPLGAAVRFLHWGLFLDATFPSWRAAQGTLFSLHYFAVDTLWLMAATWLGYRLERTYQMTHQYGWLYRRTSPLTWGKRADTS